MADPSQGFKVARKVERVTFAKDGIRAVIGDADEYIEMMPPSALHVLRCECTIDPDVTLEDIIRVVERDEELGHFLGAWCQCDSGAFHSEACKPSDECGLDCIEVAKGFT